MTSLQLISKNVGQLLWLLQNQFQNHWLHTHQRILKKINTASFKAKIKKNLQLCKEMRAYEVIKGLYLVTQFKQRIKINTFTGKLIPKKTQKKQSKIGRKHQEKR